MALYSASCVRTSHFFPALALEFERGQSAHWVLFAREGDAYEAVGTANVSQIVRGPFQAAYLGYQIARRHEGKGLMAEALRAGKKGGDVVAQGADGGEAVAAEFDGDRALGVRTES